MIKPAHASTPNDYISQIDSPRREEIQKIYNFILKVVPHLKPFIEPNMGTIIGFGQIKFKSSSGREGKWFIIGLASQKNYISVYACASDGKRYVPEKYKSQLPKANIGKSCIRFKSVSAIDLKVLKTIILESERLMRGQLITSG